ncbi:MAG: hypothetical protein O2904_04920 [bacterium]|nr:hypothetical protein [bacterium]
MKHSERVTIFVTEIWNWYARHKRELPWRDLQIADDTQRAYQIMVSEIMLQQTQVTRVKIVFRNFLSLYPKIGDLAAAPNADVILAWRGMGYNSRALRLRDAARALLEFRVPGSGSRVTSQKLATRNPQPATKSYFPKEMKQLQALPGVGHYTAAAIRNFAFNIPTPCIDTNIRRILHRTFIGPEYEDGSWKKDDGYLLKLASEILDVALQQEVNPKSQIPNPKYDTANWHAALMDFGSLVCTKRSPKWDICPLAQKGIMKAAYKTLPNCKLQIANCKKEPGREMCGRYIPNRIFRGKIVEELRDEPSGLQLEEIGSRICLDWSEEEHRKWLDGLVEKLIKDTLVEKRAKTYMLAS